MSGNFDFLLKTRVADMASYRKLLGDTLLQLPGVRESRSYVVMEEVKHSNKIKINVLDLLDQLPFNGAVGALVPFEPGDFYVAIDGLPLESSSGEFIDLIDAQFTIV